MLKDRFSCKHCQRVFRSEGARAMHISAVHRDANAAPQLDLRAYKPYNAATVAPSSSPRPPRRFLHALAWLCALAAAAGLAIVFAWPWIREVLLAAGGS